VCEICQHVENVARGIRPSRETAKSAIIGVATGDGTRARALMLQALPRHVRAMNKIRSVRQVVLPELVICHARFGEQ